MLWDKQIKTNCASRGNHLDTLSGLRACNPQYVLFLHFKQQGIFYSDFSCCSNLSGLKLTAYTGPLWPYRILDSLAVFSSMILSNTSSDSLSMRLRSERKKEKLQCEVKNSKYIKLLNIKYLIRKCSLIKAMRVSVQQNVEQTRWLKGLRSPAADLTFRSFLGVTLHTRTVESAKPPAIRLESSVMSTAVRPYHQTSNFSLAAM